MRCSFELRLRVSPCDAGWFLYFFIGKRKKCVISPTVWGLRWCNLIACSIALKCRMRSVCLYMCFAYMLEMYVCVWRMYLCHRKFSRETSEFRSYKITTPAVRRRVDRKGVAESTVTESFLG